MKKLISIKSDESGEVLYFTHKKGVDTIRKDEVVDLELLNPMKISRSMSDGFSIFYFAWLIFCFLSASTNTTHLKGFIGIGILMWAIVTFPVFFVGVWSTRNSRHNLKLYTVKGIVEYRIIENWHIYSGLYDHFKPMLSKYFPNKGDVILYNINPPIRTYYRVMTYVVPILIIVTNLPDFNLFHSDFERFVFNVVYSVFLVLVTIYYYYMGYRTGMIKYTFQGKHLEKEYSFSGKSKEMKSLEEKLSKIKLVQNEENIAVIPKLYTGNMPENLVENATTDTEQFANAIGQLYKYQGREIEDVEEYIKFYEGKNGNLFHNLQVAQDFRDITPIIVRYINDLSDEQSKEA